MSKRAALYLRVSTDQQTTENQRAALELAASQRGWTITNVYADEGISGAKGREKRPGLDALLKDATRGKIDVVMAWAVDRIGRSLQDLIGTLQDLHAARVDLFLHQQAIDTTTPAGKAMFQMMGVFAEFERSMIVARINAGLARARLHPRKGAKAIGRPRISAAKEREIKAALGTGIGINKIARQCGVGSGTVMRVKQQLTAT
jgi:DNA invertase Pin-like site-specific DNA recombinase